MYIAKKIGSRIVVLRAEAGLTQQQLAKQLDTSQRTVAAWEAGDSVPRKTMQVKIAQIFGLPKDYFFDLDSDDAGSNSESINSSERKLINVVDDAISGAGIDVSEEKKKQIMDSIQEILEVKK
mgnify:FL=1